MTQEHSPYEIDGYILRLVRFKARELVKTSSVPQSDRDDIAQDLLLDILRRLPRFDPGRSSRSAFIRRVIANRIATILAARRAQRRDPARCRESLNDEILDVDGTSVERAESLDADCCMRRDGSEVGAAERRRDLRVDLDATVASLPPHLRDLCTRLERSTVTEIAAELGVPRGTVRGRIKTIRRHFRAAGLDDYAARRHPDRGPGIEKVGAARRCASREVGDA
jgi:RNA polymerase sigma-70 factor (ECF subfamily)